MIKRIVAEKLPSVNLEQKKLICEQLILVFQLQAKYLRILRFEMISKVLVGNFSFNIFSKMCDIVCRDSISR